MRYKWLAAMSLVVAALVAAACGGTTTASRSAGTPASKPATASPHATGPAAPGTALRTTTIHGTKVLTNAEGFTLYWFGPDTSTASKCNGACATAWPPVAGPATGGSGVTGKLGTVKRSNGATQATYNGHPLYTFTGDKAPGQGNGTGVNAFGGVWHEVTVSGAAPASSKPASPGGGGY